MNEWLEKLQRAARIIEGIRPIRLSCDSSGVEVQLGIDDFRRLFAGNVAQRREFHGDWHWSYQVDGITFKAVDIVGPYSNPVIEDAVVEPQEAAVA